MSLTVRSDTPAGQAGVNGHAPHRPRAVRSEVEDTALRAAARRAVFVTPLILITGFAVYGQVGYGIDHYTPIDADPAYKLVIAVGAALAIESISNYVQWQSHRSRLAGATARSATLARYSYLIAAVVGFINYQHFCGPELSPTPAALVFASFSFLSPWLWGLYSRSAEDDQRAADGTLDRAGAVFAASRWRNFPILTWRAQRYSVMHNIVDPHDAWTAFLADRRAQRIQRRTGAGVTPRRGGAGATAAPAPGAKLGSGAKPTPSGGAKPGANAGVVPGASSGADAGVTGGAVTRVTPEPAHRSPAPQTPPSRPAGGGEQAALRDAATDWAIAQAARTGAVPGWRTLHAATDDSGRPLFADLTEYAVKQAARIARERAAGAGR